jgi:predicted transcriptional regulator
MTNKNSNIVLQKLSLGWTQQEIADHLQLSQSTISLDCQYLMEKSKKDLENHISDVIPYRYAQCMEGLRDVLREINNIIERTTDDKTRMAGLQLRTNI